MNRMNRDELFEKFERHTSDKLTNYMEVWDLVWRIDKVSDVSELAETINAGLRT